MIQKPWGSYEDYYRSESVVFKTISVAPYAKLSLQTHKLREEIWVCLKGNGVARIGDKEIPMNPGTKIEVQKGQVHQLMNQTGFPLLVAELQIGICQEEDIIRLQDDYGRI